MLMILINLAVFLTTLAGVELYRRQALKRKFYDVPNARSLHLTPTPRGGGIVMAITCLSFYWLYFLSRGGGGCGYFLEL